MKNSTSIQIKALILFVAFFLNTAIGFACSLGVNMGFNDHHLKISPDYLPIHIHKDGKNHHHSTGSKNSHGKDKAVDLHHGQSKGTGSTHSHVGNAAVNHKHEANKAPEKGSCCNGKVIKFAKADKYVSPIFHLGVNPIFLAASISLFFIKDVLVTSQVTSSSKYFVRSHHPPIPDIRIAIQSFQI